MFVQRKYFVFLRKLKKQHTYQPIQILQIFVTLSMECYVGWRKTKIKQKKPAPGKLWKKFSEVKSIKVVTFVWMVWRKPAGEIVLSKTAWLEFLHTDTRINTLKEAFFLYQSLWLLLKPGPETLLEKLTLSSIGLRD